MVQVRCQCGKVTTTKDEYAGRRFKCPACGEILQVPGGRNQKSAAGKKKKRRKPAPAPEEELEEFEEYDTDESYDDYDDYSAPALPTRKKKSGRKNSKKKAAPASGGSEDGIPPKVMYSLFALAGVVVIGAITLIALSVKSAGDAQVNTMAAPEEFSTWKHEHGGLSSLCPEGAGWEYDEGGGTGGVPPWFSFESESQDVKVTIRGSISGTAIGDIATAGGTLPGNLGEELPDELDPVASVHDFQCQKIGSEYDEYEESEPAVIDTGFGEGRISDFTGSKLLSMTYGVRATLLASTYQYNVICRCPQDRLDEYKPIFTRIIESISH